MNALEYRRQQDKALKAVLQQVRRLFVAYGVPITPEQQQEMAELLLRSMRGARERVHTVTASYILSQYAIADIPDPDFYPVQALSAALDNALKDFTVHGDLITAKNRKDGLVVTQAGRKAQRVASRHAQQPARDAVQAVADDNTGLGWARMLTGPTSCAFCAMLASRGPVYSSSAKALQRGGEKVDTYHDGCDCIAVLVPNEHAWEGRQAFENLEDLWRNASRRRSFTEARKVFRREWNQKVRSGESGAYVADTMK